VNGENLIRGKAVWNAHQVGKVRMVHVFLLAVDLEVTLATIKKKKIRGRRGGEEGNSGDRQGITSSKVPTEAHQRRLHDLLPR